MLKAGTPGCGGSDGPRRMSCGLRAPGSRQRPADAPCGPAHRWEAACRGIERDVGPQRCERCCLRGQVERGVCRLVSVCPLPGSAPLCASSHTGPRGLVIPTGVCAACEAGAVPPSAARDITLHEGQRLRGRGRQGAGVEGSSKGSSPTLGCGAPLPQLSCARHAMCGTRRC